jgi:hypothetical protein
MRLLLNVLIACLAEKTSEHGGNAKMVPIRRETVSSSLHGASTQCADFLTGGTGADALLCLGRADYTTGTCDTYTFLKSERVGLPGDDLTIGLCGQHPNKDTSVSPLCIRFNPPWEVRKYHSETTGVRFEVESLIAVFLE